MPCSATSAGIATPRAPTSARRAAPCSTASRPTTPRSPSPDRVRQRRGRGGARRRRSTRCHEGAGMLVVKRGPNAGSRFSLDPTVTRPAAIPTATSSSTTSPCRGATPRSCPRRRLPGAATWARSTARTSTVSASTSAPLANGDELQIGKFKLVFFSGRRGTGLEATWPNGPICRSGRCSTSSRTSSPTSPSRRSASSRARACSTPSARRRATASSTSPTSSGCAGSCASSGSTSCR